MVVNKANWESLMLGGFVRVCLFAASGACRALRLVEVEAACLAAAIDAPAAIR